MAKPGNFAKIEAKRRETQMLQIEVMLEVPLRIAAGLAGGQLERVGGVVRDVGTKQIVALLREGGQLANGSHPSQAEYLRLCLDTSNWRVGGQQLHRCRTSSGNGTFALS